MSEDHSLAVVAQKDLKIIRLGTEPDREGAVSGWNIMLGVLNALH